MKVLILSLMLVAFGCNATKKNSAADIAPEGSKVKVDSLPVCVKVLIEKMKSEAVTNPPRKIYSYIYLGKKVFYVTAFCCDNFSDLYNDSCRLMGHPDGGITGIGDGKIKAFNTATEEKLLWADSRK